jgi:hypothetical protein
MTMVCMSIQLCIDSVFLHLLNSCLQTQLESKRTCLNGCLQTSVTFIPTDVIIVPLLDGISSLVALMRASAAATHETLKCGMCQPDVPDSDKAPVAAELSTRIRRMADSTFIQLQRYRQDGAFHGHKNNANIKIPLVIREEDVCLPGATGTFDLQGLVLHNGTLHAGRGSAHVKLRNITVGSFCT